VDAILRRLYLSSEDVDASRELGRLRFGVFSQNEEDGLVLALVRQMEHGDRRFVEIGCSDHGWNTGFLAEECGWTGLMVDGNAESVAATRLRFGAANVRAEAAFLTPETMDPFIREHGYAGEFDLLSIDVDGSDYWLWKGLTVARPRLVIIEYNAAFGPDRAVVVPFAAGREWDERARELRYYGASLRALQRLGEAKGYRLVAIEPDSANAFLMRHDVAPRVPAVDPAAVFRAPRKHRQAGVPHAAELLQALADGGLPLIER
jgi:hypothetical protein